METYLALNGNTFFKYSFFLNYKKIRFKKGRKSAHSCKSVPLFCLVDTAKKFKRNDKKNPIMSFYLE